MTATTIPDADDGADITASGLRAKLAWLAARYMPNLRDDLVVEVLREILDVSDDGTILPTPIRDPLTGETQGAAIIAPSDTGKSALMGRNLRALPGFERMTDGTTGNYVHCTVPPEATIKGLGEEITAMTGYTTFAPKARAYDVWGVARHRMAERGVGVLVIEEFHNVLRGGPGRDVAGGLQSLKALLQGDTAVAVILTGVPKLAEVMLGDEETDRRFLKLRVPAMDDRGEDAADLADFIDACCRRLGLDGPEDPAYAARIAYAARGNLGASIVLSKRIIRNALLRGQRALDLYDAARTFEVRGGRAGRGPFDPGDWTTVRARLDEAGWA